MLSKKTHKWIIRLVGPVILIFGLAVILWFTLVPGIVEKRISSALREAGYPNASIKLSKLTWSSATLEDIVLDPEYGIQVGEIRVRYSLGSLRHSRVEGIVLMGAETELGIRKGVVDLGPLADLQMEKRPEQQKKGKSGLPFDQVELRGMLLHAFWEDREFSIPVDAVVKNIGGDSVSIELEASLRGASISLGATVDVLSQDGTADVTIDRLPADLVRELSEPYLSGQELKCDGYLNVKGRVTSRNGEWRGEMTLTDDQLLLEAALETPGIELILETFRADLFFAHPGKTTIDAEAFFNRTPISFRGTIDPKTLDGECNFLIKDMSADVLTDLVKPYLQDQSIDFRGQMTAEGRLTCRQGRLVTGLKVEGGRLSLLAAVSGRQIQLFHPMLNAEVRLAYDRGEVQNIRGELELYGMSMADTILGLTVEEVACKIPFSLEKTTVEQGAFTIKNLRGDLLEVPEISGSISVKNERANINLSGNVLPEAVVEASGWIDLGGKELSGAWDVHVPRFTLESTSALTERLPALSGCDLGGTFEVDAHMMLEKNHITPRIRIDLEDVFYERPETKTGIEGLTGMLIVKNITPFETDGDQRLTWKNVKVGNFETSDGVVQFSVCGDESIILGSIESNWADGKLWSDSILVRPASSFVSCDFHAEKLSLQGILDFLEYDGVKGTGWIYGNLPVGVSWGRRTQVSFGDGILEANPQKGRLQLSKKTAMTILGMTHDIDPATVDSQEMAKLLMLRALQDMEYSSLQVTFHDEGERGWVTDIQIKGHGPVGDKENRVPIAGLDIEVNNLDDLLNNIILPGLQSRDIELNNLH